MVYLVLAWNTMQLSSWGKTRAPRAKRGVGAKKTGDEAAAEPKKDK